MPDDRRLCEAQHQGNFAGELCPVCAKLMKKRDRIAVWFIKTNWFRGDDEVYAAHDHCESGLADHIANVESARAK